MKLATRTALAAAVAIGTTGSAQAVTIANPSFATGAGGSFVTKSGAQLDGWLIGGTIDHIGSYWQSADGDGASIDLNGNGIGSIEQTLTGLTNGVTYLVSFYISGNPDNNRAPLLKTATLTLGSGTNAVSYSVDTNTRGNMEWERVSYSFVADGTEALLRLASTTGGSYGLAVDNFSISAVPEPATWAMMIGGFGAAGVTLRRRRRVMGRAATA